MQDRVLFCVKCFDTAQFPKTTNWSWTCRCGKATVHGYFDAERNVPIGMPFVAARIIDLSDIYEYAKLRAQKS